VIAPSISTMSCTSGTSRSAMNRPRSGICQTQRPATCRARLEEPCFRRRGVAAHEHRAAREDGFVVYGRTSRLKRLRRTKTSQAQGEWPSRSPPRRRIRDVRARRAPTEAHGTERAPSGKARPLARAGVASDALYNETRVGTRNAPPHARVGRVLRGAARAARGLPHARAACARSSPRRAVRRAQASTRLGGPARRRRAWGGIKAARASTRTAASATTR
jgi:hypothetical protein